MRTTHFRTPAHNGIINITGRALPLIFTGLSELLNINIFPHTLTIKLALPLLLLSPVENEGEWYCFYVSTSILPRLSIYFGLLKLTACSQNNLIFWH